MEPVWEREQACDGLQDGGLAGAVGADEGDDLPLIYLKGDVLDGVDGAVIDVDALYLQHGVHIRPLLLFLTAQIGLDDHWVGLDLLRGALGDDLSEVEHADALADAHDQVHVVLDEHNGDLEGVPDLDDVLHQLGGLGGVHAGGGLVQQQQGGVGGQGPDDLQAALGAVRQGAGLVVGQVLHVEDGQQLHGALVGPASPASSSLGRRSMPPHMG